MSADKFASIDNEINHIITFLQREAKKKKVSTDTFESMCQIKICINQLHNFNYNGTYENKIKFLELQLDFSNSIIQYMTNKMPEQKDLITELWSLNWLVKRMFIDKKIDSIVTNIDNDIKNNPIKTIMP